MAEFKHLHEAYDVVKWIVVFLADWGAAVGTGFSAQFEEQLWRPWPSAPYTGYTGAGHGQPYGPPLYTRVTDKTWEEGKGGVTKSMPS